MQINTLGNGFPSRRNVTVGHAVQILVTEVLQAGGEFDSCGFGSSARVSGTSLRFESLFDSNEPGIKPDRFRFCTASAEFEFRGSAPEVERFINIVSLARKAGRMTADKFDPCSQKIWMLSVLRHHEFDFTALAFDQRTTLLELADEIDQIINRHGLVTFPKETAPVPS
jgi:hypothetical protein